VSVQSVARNVPISEHARVRVVASHIGEPAGEFADFDAMAACEPAAAIWVVDSRDTAHDVIGALHDPLSGPQRVTKTYSENTAPGRFTYDTDGLTDMTTLGSLYRDLSRNA